MIRNQLVKISPIIFVIAFSCFNTASYANHGTATGMVVSEEKIASQIGANILQSGGNAIDAAVAVGYALAVIDPCCGNIGGGGFMTIRLANGRQTVLNFREIAPEKASKKMFLDAHQQPMADQSLNGYLAVAVPGTVLGLDTALQKYGTMTRKQVMSPSIQLAKNGFLITPYEAERYKQYENEFRQQPNVAAVFLHDGHSLQPGYRLIQKDLAATLQLIADKGPSAFYQGPIAQSIVAASNKQGGILSLDDFKHYHVDELAPLHCAYRGYTVIAPPPPASGVTLCEMLSILDHLPVHASPAIKTRYIIEAMRYGFEDRNNKLGDPNFVKNPVTELLSPSYAEKLSLIIGRSHSPPPHQSLQFHKELTDTTHYSVVDRDGNAVSVTYTLNGFFGAGVIADTTGFFLNDEMDDFATAPGIANKFGLVQHEMNAVAPGKRPLSSMTPVIILKSGQLFMVLGSPGGPRIISSVLLTILNTIDEGMSLTQAVDSPRYHYQGEPDSVDIEPNALTKAVQQQIETWNYHFTPQPHWGAVAAIKIDPTTKILEGSHDRRRPDGGVATAH